MPNVSTAHTGRQDTWAVVDDSLARETVEGGRNGMRSADGENPPPNRRATAKRGSPTYSPEQRETMRRGLRILARMIARAHLRRQASPVRGCAQVSQRRTKTGTERLTEPSFDAPHVRVPLSPLRSHRCPIAPAKRHVPLSPFS